MTLTEARKQSGFKTSYICKQMNFTRAYLYGLEKGLYPCSVLHRKKFAELYGYKVTDIQYTTTN